MKTPIKTVSLPEETYNELKEQAENESRTISGQIKHLLKLSERQGDRECGE